MVPWLKILVYPFWLIPLPTSYFQAVTVESGIPLSVSPFFPTSLLFHRFGPLPSSLDNYRGFLTGFPTCSLPLFHPSQTLLVHGASSNAAVPELFKIHSSDIESHKLRGPWPSTWPRHIARVLFPTSSMWAGFTEFIFAFPPLGFCLWWCLLLERSSHPSKSLSKAFPDSSLGNIISPLKEKLLFSVQYPFALVSSYLWIKFCLLLVDYIFVFFFL